MPAAGPSTQRAARAHCAGCQCLMKQRDRPGDSVRVNDIYVAGVASWLPPREPIGQGRYAPGVQDEYAWESASVAEAGETVVSMAVRAGQVGLGRSGGGPGG